MIANPDEARALPLLAPMLSHNGPYRPGTAVRVMLPLRNLRVGDERDVRVRFRGEAVTFDPEVIACDSLRPGETKMFETTATVLPLNGKRSIAVWAEVETAESPQTLLTAEIRAPITARSALRLSAFETGASQVSINLENAGDAPAPVTLEIVGPTGAPPSEGATFSLLDDRIVSEPIYLEPGQHSVVNVQGHLERVFANSSDGERSTANVVALSGATPAIVDPYFNVSFARHGARRGDLLPFVLEIAQTEPSAPPLDGLTAEITLPSCLRLLSETLAVDDVGIVPQDLRVTEQIATIILGRLEGGRRMQLRGAFLMDADDCEVADDFEVAIVVVAPGIETRYANASVCRDTRPIFAPATTFVGEIEGPDADGLYHVAAEITNAEASHVNLLRVRWDLVELLPVRAWRQGQEINVQPTTIDGRPTILTDVGALGPYGRVRLGLDLRPTVSDRERREASVDATLVAPNATLPLGVVNRTLVGKPSLASSTFLADNDVPLRMGLPTSVTLTLRNDGDAPARDIRLALDLPDVIAISLPDATDGRWRRVCAYLPPGGLVSTQVAVMLTGPPQTPFTPIAIEIDARNHQPAVLQTLTLYTPTRPLIDAPVIRLEPLADGLLLATAIVANVGDGAAASVRVSILDDGTALARSTRIDRVPFEDRGPNTALIGGIDLGDLLPGGFREVSWILVPRDDAAHHARLTVAYDKCEVVGESPARRARSQAQLATALPPARRLDGRAVDDLASPAQPRKLPNIGAQLECEEDLLGLRAAPEDAQPALAMSGGVRALGGAGDTPLASTVAPLAVSAPKVDSGGSTGTAASSKVEEAFAGSTRRDDGQAAVPMDHEPSTSSAEVRSSGPADDQTTSTPPAGALIGRLQSPSMRRILKLAAHASRVPQLGWWRHVLVLRGLLVDVEDVPGDDAAHEAYTNLRSALDVEISECFGLIVNPDFALTLEWIRLLTQYDQVASDAINVYNEAIGDMTRVQTSGEINAALTRFIPETVDNPTIDRALLTYRTTLRDVFSRSEVASLSDSDRNIRFGTMPHATLDEQLEALLQAAHIEL